MTQQQLYVLKEKFYQFHVAQGELLQFLKIRKKSYILPLGRKLKN